MTDTLDPLRSFGRPYFFRPSYRLRRSRNRRKELKGEPRFSPVEGLDEAIWDSHYDGCHEWNWARLCGQEVSPPTMSRCCGCNIRWGHVSGWRWPKWVQDGCSKASNQDPSNLHPLIGAAPRSPPSECPFRQTRKELKSGPPAQRVPVRPEPPHSQRGRLAARPIPLTSP